MKRSDEPIVVELPVSADVATIWAALTDSVLMRKWFFDNMSDFKAEPGFETRFDVSSEERVFPHVWKVIEVVPYEKLVVNWTYDGYEGSSNVHFEIFAGDDSNTVRLSTEVLEDFQQDIPEFKRESAVEGWDYLINGELKEFLESQ